MRTIDAEHFLISVGLDESRIPPDGGYPFSLAAVANLGTLEFHPSVTFLVGENGTGKSTLLEAIAVAWGFNAEGGTKNFNFASRASHSCLHEYIDLARGVKRPEDGYFLRAESFYNVATEIDKLDEAPAASAPIINSFGGKSLHEQSHGESFLSLFMHRFGGKGLYILDEPEAALSPSRQMAMLARLHDLVKAGSQFIIATHSPIIMAYPDAAIHMLTEDSFEQVEYTDTEHYIVARRFLHDHEAMLKTLLEDDPA